MTVTLLMAIVGQEVEIDDVAERFVDAHAVLIDGHALRDAIDRRSFKAAILDIRLEAVALNVADGDARARAVRESPAG